MDFEQSWQAIGQDHIDMMRYLVETHEANMLAPLDDLTPLQNACGERHIDIVKYLAEEDKVDVDGQ